MTTVINCANAMVQYEIAAMDNSHSSGEVSQSLMRLSKFTHRLNVNLVLVNGKLCSMWDWGILFQKGAHHAMRTPKTGGACTDVIPT